MRIPVIRFRKEYRFKGRMTLLLLFCSGIVFIPGNNRSLLFSFFSTECKSYDQATFSRKLNDMVPDYSSLAMRSGIARSRNKEELDKRISEGKLVKIRTNRRFIVEEMTHSYPYLTKESKELLNEIGKRFRKKVANNGLKGSRFILTSMTRTTEKIEELSKNNGNVSENSPHLYGNAFDITYVRFSANKLFVSQCDKRFMKEALAEVIWQLRQEKKCWATYERGQYCFHVVSR